MIQKVVISLGGSIINRGRFRRRYVEKLALLLNNYAHKTQFYIICGGGVLARKMMNTAKTDVEKDLAGIQATWINAENIKKVMEKVLPTYPNVLKKLQVVPTRYKVVIGAGWIPGRTTDTNATEIAASVGAQVVINISNIDYLYTKDPKLPGAKILKSTTWNEFLQIVGKRRVPGGNYPFDPVAAMLAKKNKIAVVIINGNKFWRVKNILDGKILGTYIS